MEKRFGRTELWFTLGFLFTLILAVGAFFYGVKVGSDKAENKFIEQTTSQSLTTNPLAYQQQDLVSFYHTVYLPYREFQNTWLQTMTKLAAGRLINPSSSMKDLAGLAERQYREAARSVQPNSSPLLVLAQRELLLGMKALGAAAAEVKDEANRLTAGKLAQLLNKNEQYAKGVQHVLAGQTHYYASMQLWGSGVNPQVPRSFEFKPLLSLQSWQKLPLIVKNKVSAEHLQARKQLVSFLPHDLTGRIDEFILSGQAGKMKIKTADALIDLLISTKAVRSGDFSNIKAILYDDELLPQLPFFYPEQDLSE